MREESANEEIRKVLTDFKDDFDEIKDSIKEGKVVDEPVTDDVMSLAQNELDEIENNVEDTTSGDFDTLEPAYQEEEMVESEDDEQEIDFSEDRLTVGDIFKFILIVILAISFIFVVYLNLKKWGIF